MKFPFFFNMASLPRPHVVPKRLPFIASLPKDTPFVTEFDPKTVPPHQSLFYAA